MGNSIEVALLATRLSMLGHDPCGGSEVVLWEDSGILKQAGISVRVYGRGANARAPVEILPIRIPLPLVSSIEYCGKLLLREPESVLIGYNEPALAGFAPARTIARFDWPTPLPKYWSLPGWLSRFQRGFYLFPSEYERRSFWEKHYLIPEERTRVIPNSVDLSLFRPQKENYNSSRVGFAGQWSNVKGLGQLLDAWPLVQEICIGAALRIAGGVGLWKGHRNFSDPSGLAQRVKRMAGEGALQIVGELKHAQMPGFWNSVDIAVVPSIREPFGLVALEALACGVPVVASAVGGLPEIVIHGECGLLVPPDNPRQLAEALVALLCNQQLRRTLAQGALRRAQGFSLEVRSQSLLCLIRATGSSCLSDKQ